MGRVLTHSRIAKLEEAFGPKKSRCIWCEQSYWTGSATMDAMGPYAQTDYGREANYVFARELQELTQDCDHRLDHLPRYELGIEHEGVLEAYERVEESRPPKERCECFEVGQVLRSIEAKVLYHYPRVAEQVIKDLEAYATSPLNKPLNCAFSNQECPCR